MIPDSLWSELETEAQTASGTGTLKRLIGPDADCTMFLGIQRPSLNRVFMVRIPRSVLPERDQIPESQGFELTAQITGEEPEHHVTLVLSATDRVYNEVFSAMTENLYRSLHDCRNERELTARFIERLHEWQQFFERNRLNGLSEEGQRGLYGELWFIRHHLLISPDRYFAAVAGWTGPKNRQHDFQFGETAVEVKTCSTKQHQKLMITSEQQLDETLVGELFVFHVSLSLVENHPDTLPALVEDLRGLLKQSFPAAAEFENALTQRGYLNTQAWRYQRTGYVIRETNGFRVIGSFPRLTERDLPPGVGDLTYSINVAECRAFAVPMDEVISRIAKG